jgi:hypothetical protein
VTKPRSFPIAWREMVYAVDGRVLSWRAKAVAGPISLYMDWRGGSIWPSVSRLAAQASISRRTVLTGLGELRESGFLVVVKKGGGRHRPTIYKACIPVLTVQDVHSFGSETVHEVQENGARGAQESAQESAHSIKRAARAGNRKGRAEGAPFSGGVDLSVYD